MSGDDRRHLSAAAWSTAAVFGAFGVVIGAWSSRLPDVAGRVGVDHAGLGVALTCLAVGCVTGMVLLGRVIVRVRTGTLLPVVVGTLGPALVVTGLVDSPTALGVALVVLGVVQGTCNVVMNAHAAALQQHLGRTVLGRFHAVFSIGGFLGAGIGAATAATGGAAVSTFGVAAGCCAAAACATWATRRPPAPAVHPATAATSRTCGVPPVRVVAVLGALALVAMTAEGTVGDWGAVHLRDDVGAAPAVAALAYSSFAIAMTAARVVVDRAVDRFGSVRVLRWSALVAAVSLAVAALGTTPVVVLVAFAGLGVGLAAVAPTVYGSVGADGRAMSIVVGTGYVGFLLGPAVIGVVSALAGLSAALLVPAVLLVVVVVGAGATRWAAVHDRVEACPRTCCRRRRATPRPCCPPNPR